MTTHSIKLFTSLDDIRTVCERKAAECGDDVVVGPQDVSRIDCMDCLRVLAKHGHTLRLLGREKGAAGIVQVALDEIESLGREALNSERADYRAGCRSGVRAWAMLKDLMVEVTGG